jgi:hypothetical protein
VPPIGLGQAVTFFEKTLKKAAISPKPLWQALEGQRKNRMELFFKHIRSKSHKFTCSKASGASDDLSFSTDVSVTVHDQIDENKIDRIAAELDESYLDFINLYKSCNGVDLYIQEKMPAISIYTIKSCMTKNKKLKKWFQTFPSEAVNRIKSKGIAFGEVGDSSNMLMYENGAISLARWWDDDIELGSLPVFLDNLATDPIATFEQLGSVIRFYDKGDTQFVPRKYEQINF